MELLPKPFYSGNGVLIYCGDTLSILEEMDKASVDLVVTSPPYPGVPEMWGELFEPDNFDRAHFWLDCVWNECARVLRPGCKMVVNIANTRRRPLLPNAARVAMWGWKSKRMELIAENVWNKGYGQGDTAWGTWRNPADPSFCDDHEMILIFRKRGERARPTTAPIIDTANFMLWRHSIQEMKPASATREKHVAPFPEGLALRAINMLSFPGETVLDPFAGSGTTLRVARLHGRVGVGIDYNEKYCERMARDASQVMMWGWKSKMVEPYAENVWDKDYGQCDTVWGSW